MKKLPHPSYLAPLFVAAIALAWPVPAAARVYSLSELIELAKHSNPGLAASAQQTVGIEAQLSEARRSWLPSGELTSLLAPSPELRCFPDVQNCTRTVSGNSQIRDATLNFKGIFTRTEVRLVQPIWDFGKISAARHAAEAGIAASRNREAGVAAEMELNIRKAYWGVKLAREMMDTIKEGTDYLDTAQDRIKKELASGKGSATPTDRLRLASVRSEVDVRTLEAQKLAALARSGLRALVGPEAPLDIEVDDGPLEALEVAIRPLPTYEEQARLSRPEVLALNHLVVSKRALADFERRKQYPDLVLVGTAVLAYAGAVDDPVNAFYNDPFNTKAAGLAAALRVPLDLAVRNARSHRVDAEAEEAFHRRREALGGILFEVERAYAELVEAQGKRKVIEAGAKNGKAWITTVAQNFAAGLAETKDFADALVSSFTFRVRALQAVYDLNVAVATLSRAVGSDITATR
jgi:multidrug efflux system outer membrane protein